MSEAKTVRCYHCQLDTTTQVPWQTVLADSRRYFCCHACQQVCQTIHATGLGEFYHIAVNETRPIPEPCERAFDEVNAEHIYADYIVTDGDTSTITLYLSQIHCAACVWLIERALLADKAVISATVNLAKKQLTLQWRTEVTKLTPLLLQLQKIGYKAVVLDPAVIATEEEKQHRQWLYRIGVAAFAMMNMLWLSIALYSGAEQGDFRQWFYWLSAVIATPSFFYLIWPFASQAYRGIRQQQLTMDVPIVIGVSVTYGYSCYQLLTASNGSQLYFDMVVNFLFIIIVGRYLESAARRQAIAKSEALIWQSPAIARVLTAEGQQMRAVELVNIRDRVLIKAGERICVDGIVVEGEAQVESALLTGEAQLSSVSEGDTVLAGMMNQQGYIIVEVTRENNQTQLAQINQLIETAQQEKPYYQTLADAVVPKFVLATLLLAIMTAVYWSLQGQIEIAVMTAVSVLIITCPCALGLASPLASAIATGVAAKRGLIVKSGQALERLSAVQHWFFDKTGTLTVGQLQVEQYQVVLAEHYDEVLRAMSAIEAHIDHPIATAIEAYRQQYESALLPTVQDCQYYQGQGVTAIVGQDNYIIGNAAFLGEQDVACSTDWCLSHQATTPANHSEIWVAKRGQIVAWMTLSDVVKTDAGEVCQHIQQQGMTVAILSGDRHRYVAAMSAQLGITEYYAEQLPSEKLAQVKAKQSDAVTVMVGDGMNDSPVIAEAAVSMAYASGSQLSTQAADIILLASDVRSTLFCQQLAKTMVKIIRQNQLFSLVYHLIMIPLAMIGWITPLLAAVTMPLSSLCVIINSMRLYRYAEKSK